jgi:hypothetical protein
MTVSGVNRTARLSAISLLVAVLALSPALPAAASTSLQVITIKTLSSRADLISGGRALVEIDLPAGAPSAGLVVTLNGQDISASFAPRPALGGRIVGLASGMAVGANHLIARQRGLTGAQLTITNHPIGGPVFAGPQTQPWFCTTQQNGLGPPTDAQCDAPTQYFWYYKSAATGAFSPMIPATRRPRL